MRKLRWFLNLLLAVAIALVLILFVYEPVRVEGYSMQPRLDNNERLFIDKFAFSIGPITGLGSSLQRGDVVVFHYPRDPTQSFIKRIIGLPGDRIQIRAGNVLLNGRRLIEPYVPDDFTDYRDYAPITVPADEYYVLGDHRNSSNDSRVWGCLDQRYIFGRAVFAYWPMQDLGLVH